MHTCMHHASLVRAARRVFTAIPDCAHGPENSCPWVDFKRLALSKLSVPCVGVVRAWVDANV